MNKKTISKHEILSLVTDYAACWGEKPSESFFRHNMDSFINTWAGVKAFELYLLSCATIDGEYVRVIYSGAANGAASVLGGGMEIMTNLIKEAHVDMEINAAMERLWSDHNALVRLVMDGWDYSYLGNYGRDFVVKWRRALNELIRETNSSALLDYAFVEHPTPIAKAIRCQGESAYRDVCLMQAYSLIVGCPPLLKRAVEEYGFDSEACVDECRSYFTEIKTQMRSATKDAITMCAIKIIWTLSDTTGPELISARMLLDTVSPHGNTAATFIDNLFFPNGFNRIRSSIRQLHPDSVIILIASADKLAPCRAVRAKAFLMRNSKCFLEERHVINCVDHIQRVALRASTPSFRALVMAYALM